MPSPKVQGTKPRVSSLFLLGLVFTIIKHVAVSAVSATWRHGEAADHRKTETLAVAARNSGMEIPAIAPTLRMKALARRTR